jgi:uncharacterized membrane-anchored protein YitT (DUF2179 family)
MRKAIRPYAERIINHCQCYARTKNFNLNYIIDEIDNFRIENTSISPGPLPLIYGIFIGVTMGIFIGMLF